MALERMGPSRALRQILPLDDGELKQIIAYVSDLPDTDRGSTSERPSG